ncbi:MAG TPA: GFA family protein [Sphingomonas sp.]|nr:GFA family protein [Sphingomonas sp.]
MPNATDAPATRTATCRCGQLRATCTGDPVRVSVCHCLDCQKRSGSSFAAQARWPDAQVRIEGDTKSWTCTSESGNRATFLFCPVCGGTIAYASEGVPGLTAIPLGTFADPDFPPPDYSVYEGRKHAWVAIVGDGIEHWR